MEFRDIHKKVNYKKVYSKANELLASTSTINSFPYQVKGFVSEMTDLYVWSGKKFKKVFGKTIKDYGSDAAILLEVGGVYYIVYNENDCLERIRFSILHELGHYILRHNMNLKVTDEKYHIQELEANCFAAQLLMPEQILREIQGREVRITKSLLTEKFGVSNQAADKRILTLARTNAEWKSREESAYDDIIKFRYGSYIESIAPAKMSFSYNFDYEYERQLERDSWINDRW